MDDEPNSPLPGTGPAMGGDNPNPVQESVNSCDLTVYTDDNQLDSPLLKAIAAAAFDQRDEVNKSDPVFKERLGNPNKSHKLGFQQQKADEGTETAGAYVYPFLAILTYTCPNEPTATLEWEKKSDPSAAYTPDAPALIPKLTIGNSSDPKSSLQQLGGACWKAAVDTPGKATLSGKGDPTPPTKNVYWRVIGKVTWKAGKPETCFKQVEVTFDAEKKTISAGKATTYAPPAAK